MQLISRLRGRRTDGDKRRPGGLPADARAMRATLAQLHAEQQLVHGARSQVRLREIVRDLFEGEIAAPTADVAELIRADTDPDELYDRELGPAWEGLNESQRAARVDGFVELAQLVDEAGALPGLSPEVVHTKALILAWAFDETYGYISRLARGEDT
jgi:hypothetical protein